MRKILVCAAAVCICSIVCAQHAAVAQSTCKGPGSARGDGNESVTFQVSGSVLTVEHRDFSTYCCLEAAVKVEVGGKDILIRETNQDGICRCMCTYDIVYEVFDLPAGDFTVRFFNLEGTEIASERVTLPGEIAAPPRLTIAECSPSTDAEAVLLTAGAGDARITHHIAAHQCCAQFTVTYVVGPDFITVREYDMSEMACLCLCPFDLELTVPAVLPGEYLVSVYGSDKQLRVEEKLTIGEAAVAFLRGEVNGDGRIDIADAIWTLSYLFARGAAPACEKAADANDDGKIDIADAVAILGHLFGARAALPAPFPDAGTDPTPDSLPCKAL